MVTLMISDGTVILLRFAFVLHDGARDVWVSEPSGVSPVRSLLKTRVERVYASGSVLRLGFEGGVEIESPAGYQRERFAWAVEFSDGRGSVTGRTLTAPAVSDDDQLAEIAAHDGVADQVREVTYFFHFRFNGIDARAAACELGDTAGADEEIDGTDLWHVWAFRPQHISARACAQARVEMERIAARHGGHYLGWDLTRLGSGNIADVPEPLFGIVEYDNPAVLHRLSAMTSRTRCGKPITITIDPDPGLAFCESCLLDEVIEKARGH
jgi:hypothetical protein